MAYQTALVALADPTRRAVFEKLRRGPRSVGTLAEGLPVSRPAVSQHLRVLRDAGLVEARRDGNRSVYSASPTGLEELRGYLEGFWSDVMKGYEDAAKRRSS